MNTVVSMTEESNFLYLIDETNKVAQFDIYGTLISTYQFNQDGLLCINETGILSLEEHKIYGEYNAKIGVIADHLLISELPSEITEEPVAWIAIGDRCFIATKKQLYCFEISS